MSTSHRHMPVAEVAKHVRAALKATFPTTKFSVRSSSYSMGASIDVSWTDGPTPNAVECITEPFAGATFDGMTDMKEYKGAMIVAGESVRSGADYIICHRELSDAGWQLVATKVAQVFNVPMPLRADAHRVYPVIGSHEDFGTYVYRASRDRGYLAKFH